MKKRFNYAWIVLITCYLMFFVSAGAGIATLSIYIVPISDALGVENSAFSVVISLAAVTVFLLSMLFGVLKKIGLKKLMVIGLCTSTAAMAMFAFSQSLIMYYVAAVFMGIGYVGGTSVICSTVITSWFVKSQGTVLGIVFTAPNFGAMLFMPLVSIWIEKLGYSASFLICGGAMLITMVIVSIFMKAHPSDKGLEAYGANEVKPEEVQDEKDLSGLTMKQALKTIHFWLLILTALFLGLAMPAFQSIMPVFLNETGFGLIFVGTVMGACALFSSFSDIIMGFINDKFGILATNAFGCGCFILSVLLLLIGKAETLIWISAILLGIGLAQVSVPIPMMVKKVFGNKVFGTIMGIAFGLTFLGFAIGTPLLNVISEVTGKFEYTLITCIIMVVIAFVLSAIALKKKLNVTLPTPVANESKEA